MVIRKILYLFLSINALFIYKTHPSAAGSPTTAHSSPCSVIHLLDISRDLCLRIAIPSTDWKSEYDPRLEKGCLKYVPQSRQPGVGYSEKLIIDIQKGDGYSAIGYCQNVLTHIKSNYKNRIIEASSSRLDGHATARIIAIFYIPEKQHCELFCLESHSGVCGCAGYQYSIILSAAMTEEIALEKIRSFTKANVDVEMIPWSVPYLQPQTYFPTE